MTTNLVADGGYILDAGAAPVVLPPGLPDVMDAGIYFGLDEAEYHAAHALSASGIKWLRISPLDFWARSSMNPDREPEEESQAKVIGKAYHKRIAEGRAAFLASFAPEVDPKDYPTALRTVDDLKEAIAGLGAKPKGKSKGDLIAQLAALDPTAKVWSLIEADHAAIHDGRTMLPADLIRRIEISAAMIEKHPDLRKAFTGGYPEVSIFWTDPEYGIPMKSRLDYLKRAAVVDLKTFENGNGMPIDKAIARAIANYKYHIQARLYLDAVREARKHIKAGRVFGQVDPAFLDAVAKSDGHTFMLVFQQKGPAPVARGKILPRIILDIGSQEIEDAKRIYAQCRETYGADPWIDASPVEEMDSTAFPAYITD